jgi:hypothetical protein
MTLDRILWKIEDALDFVFTPNTTPIISVASFLAWLTWLSLTGYTILTNIPQEHWNSVLFIVVLVWCGTNALHDWPGKNKRD